MGADNTFGETNFNPKSLERQARVKQVAKQVGEDVKKILESSSEPLEEKPFLTEDDCDKAYEISPCTEAKDYYSGFLTAASKANARISELDKEVKQACIIIEDLNMQLASLESELKALENRYKDLSGALRFKYEECEALREERDKERDRIKTYLMEFIEERKQLCKTVSEDAPAAWKSFRLVADAVETELDFLQSVIHAIEPYPETTKPIP